MIKIGEKKLFHRNALGTIVEINPKCVLDFYVHESCQRSGIGKVFIIVTVNFWIYAKLREGNSSRNGIWQTFS